GGGCRSGVGPVDDLGRDQLVGEVLEAAEARLEEIAPAAAHSAQPSPGPVADEDRLPLAGDELFPAEALHLFRIVVIHSPNSKGCRARRGAAPPARPRPPRAPAPPRRTTAGPPRAPTAAPARPP